MPHFPDGISSKGAGRRLGRSGLPKIDERWHSGWKPCILSIADKRVAVPRGLGAQGRRRRRRRPRCSAMQRDAARKRADCDGCEDARMRGCARDAGDVEGRRLGRVEGGHWRRGARTRAEPATVGAPQHRGDDMTTLTPTQRHAETTSAMVAARQRAVTPEALAHPGTLSLLAVHGGGRDEATHGGPHHRHHPHLTSRAVYRQPHRHSDSNGARDGSPHAWICTCSARPEVLREKGRLRESGIFADAPPQAKADSFTKETCAISPIRCPHSRIHCTRKQGPRRNMTKRKVEYSNAMQTVARNQTPCYPNSSVNPTAAIATPHPPMYAVPVVPVVPNHVRPKLHVMPFAIKNK